MTDEDLFNEDPPEDGVAETGPPWQVLVVDDDEAVHLATRFALLHLVFRNRTIELHHAYSCEGGLKKVEELPDLALIILDVVMETDDAGLRFVERLRRDLERTAVRIILRTGQPWSAPEERVVVDYDINDYKAKTELTAARLFTSTVSALRAYADIRTIERYSELAYDVMRDEAALCQQVLEFIALPLAHADSLLHITGCNEAFAQALGADRALLVGAHIRDVMPADAAAFLEHQPGQVDRDNSLTSGPLRLPSGGRYRLHKRQFIRGDGSAGGVLCRIEWAGGDGRAP